MKPGVKIRVIVIRSLVRIAEQEKRSQDELNEILGGKVPFKDRQLITELLYGSLRYAPFFLREINDRLKKGVAGTDPQIVWTLVVALYQLRVLDRIPEHAAVSTSVDAAKTFGGVGASRLVNGVLRAMLRAGLRDIDVERCYPGFIRSSFKTLGVPVVEVSESFLGHSPYSLRGRGDWLKRPGEIVAFLKDHEMEGAHEGRVPGAIILPRGGQRLRRLSPEERKNAPQVLPQDEASQAVSRAAISFLEPGSQSVRILDACAGRGVKAEYIASSLGERGDILAIDISEPKLVQAAKLSPGLKYQRHNWKTGTIEGLDPFDLVLVDAPCSGLGTLRRRPEIRLLTRRPEIGSLVESQERILANTATLVKPGGVLVYVICSFTEEESDEQVRGFLASRAGADFEKTAMPTPPVPSWGQGDVWRTFDGKDVKAPADCFYATAFRRKG